MSSSNLPVRAFRGEPNHNRYQLTLDPAWKFEKLKFKAGVRHFYEWIPCKNGGIIKLFSENEIMFKLITKKPTVKKVLKEVKEAYLYAEFHNELEILFPLSVIHKVAKLAGAKRKRERKSLGPEVKKKLVEVGQAHRFPGKTAGKKGQKSPQFPSILDSAGTYKPDRQLSFLFSLYWQTKLPLQSCAPKSLDILTLHSG